MGRHRYFRPDTATIPGPDRKGRLPSARRRRPKAADGRVALARLKVGAGFTLATKGSGIAVYSVVKHDDARCLVDCRGPGRAALSSIDAGRLVYPVAVPVEGI